MFEESFLGQPPLATTVKFMLMIWCLILAPWLPFFTIMGSGMAFEGGPVLGAYYFVITAWMFPILVVLAFFFTRRKPKLIWLPALPLMLASIFPNRP